MPHATTCAPPAAKRIAIARPMPVVPVTRACFPKSSFIVFGFSIGTQDDSAELCHEPVGYSTRYFSQKGQNKEPTWLIRDSHILGPSLRPAIRPALLTCPPA